MGSAALLMRYKGSSAMKSHHKGPRTQIQDPKVYLVQTPVGEGENTNSYARAKRSSVCAALCSLSSTQASDLRAQKRLLSPFCTLPPPTEVITSPHSHPAVRSA